VRMLFHTQFVLAAITGWKLDWKSPPRDDAATGFGEALRRHGAHTMLTLVWIAAIVLSSESFAWWLTPILLGLLAAIPLSVWGSRVSIGRALRRRRLLLTPEEHREPPVLTAAAKEAEAVAARLATFRDAVADADAHARAIAAVPRRGWPHSAKGRADMARAERALRDGLEALPAGERLRLLSSPAALARLNAEIASHRAHPAWWTEGGANVDAPLPPAPDKACQEPRAALVESL